MSKFRKFVEANPDIPVPDAFLKFVKSEVLLTNSALNKTFDMNLGISDTVTELGILDEFYSEIRDALVSAAILNRK